MKRTIRLTESDLTRIVRRVIKEQDEKLRKLKYQIDGIKKTGKINISVTNQNAEVSFTDKNGQNVTENVLVTDFPFIFDVNTTPSFTPGRKSLGDKLRKHFVKLMSQGKTINITINPNADATFTFPGTGAKASETYTENLTPYFLAYVFSVQ
jgi:hypothetical protein